MASWISWLFLLCITAYGAFRFAKAVIEEDARRRAENERGWAEYEAGLRGGF